MNPLSLKPIVIAIAVLLSACSSMPKTTMLLDQTRSDFMMAQNNPQVASFAPLEMKVAGEAMAVANEAALNNDSEQRIDSLAYLAKQKIATTQEVAKQKAAEAQVQNAAKQRDQMRLDQRTAEANQAHHTAEQAKQVSQAALADTAEAQRQAKEAQRIAQEAELKTAKLEAQLADLAAKKTERGIVITFGDLLFHTDQSRLTADGMNTAQKLAVVLQQNPQRTVLAEGFTDSTGSDQHNQALSERRSEAVRSALHSLGVSRDRIAIRGYGEAFPVAGNQTADERRLNRRVEILLSDDSGKIAPR